jgi:tRNA-Thr(GGU) m(6)t(6)A37 methyltransferase TsaA
MDPAGSMDPADRRPTTADDPITLRAVGVVRSPHKVHVGTPRQPRGQPHEVVDDQPGRIEIRQGLQNLLQDLDGFSHIWVLGWLNYCYGWNDTVIPPRDTRRRGLFATRAPHRPNPIGLSVVRLLRIEKRVLHIGSHDLLDGTPVLDIKPYIPYADAVPDARAGWVDELDDRAGPDHRDWRRDEER